MSAMSYIIKRILAILIVLNIMSTMIFSIYFIVAEKYHDCKGEECPICADIELFQNVAIYLGTGIVCMTVFIVPIIVLVKQKYTFKYMFFGTPVSKKIRLNN